MFNYLRKHRKVAVGFMVLGTTSLIALSILPYIL